MRLLGLPRTRWISDNGRQMHNRIDAFERPQNEFCVADISPNKLEVRICPETKHRVPAMQEAVQHADVMASPQQH